MDKNILIEYADMKEEIKDLRRRIEQNKKEEIKILQTFTFLCLAVAVICGIWNIG